MRSHTLELQVCCALFTVGGVLVLLQNGTAYYWFPAAMIACFLVTMLEAWVILVEINR